MRRAPGIVSVFERVYSVDVVQRFKPAAEAYRSVAESLELPMDRLRVVAAHARDVVGALRAGCAAAFVARPGRSCSRLARNRIFPDRIFRSVARLIVAAQIP